jgi:hypothetical protein
MTILLLGHRSKPMIKNPDVALGKSSEVQELNESIRAKSLQAELL